MGALDMPRVVHRHQVWRLFTCIWLHGGVFHLLANMFGILVIGIRLEQEFGFGTCDTFKIMTVLSFSETEHHVTMATKHKRLCCSLNVDLIRKVE